LTSRIVLVFHHQDRGDDQSLKPLARHGRRASRVSHGGGYGSVRSDIPHARVDSRFRDELPTAELDTTGRWVVRARKHARGSPLARDKPLCSGLLAQQTLGILGAGNGSPTADGRLKEVRA